MIEESEELTRSARADEAIARATWELLEEGSPPVSLQQVARRAGLAASTVHRRYRSVDALLMTLQAEVYDEVPVADTGSVRGDLTALMTGVADAWASPARRLGLLEALVAAQSGSADLADTLAERIWAHRAATTLIVHRGVDRGEVRDDVDPALVIEALAGLAAQRLLLLRRPLTQAEALAAVDLVLHGVLMPD